MAHNVYGLRSRAEEGPEQSDATPEVRAPPAQVLLDQVHIYSGGKRREATRCSSPQLCGVDLVFGISRRCLSPAFKAAIHEPLDLATGRVVILPLGLDQLERLSELPVQTRRGVPHRGQAAAPFRAFWTERGDNDV